MVLGMGDIGVIAVIMGALVSPLYIFLIWLIRSYSSINREIGELTKDVGQNAQGIREMQTRVGQLQISVNKLMDTWSGWIKKEK